jgi:hypothetical protein
VNKPRRTRVYRARTAQPATTTLNERLTAAVAAGDARAVAELEALLADLQAQARPHARISAEAKRAAMRLADWALCDGGHESGRVTVRGASGE